MDKYNKFTCIIIFFTSFIFTIVIIFVVIGQIQTFYGQLFGLLGMIFLPILMSTRYIVQWWKSHDKKKDLADTTSVRDTKLIKKEDKGKILFKSEPKLKITKFSILGLIIVSLLILFLLYYGIYFTFNGLNKIIMEEEIFGGMFRLIFGGFMLFGVIFILIMISSFFFSYVTIYENGILHRNPNFFTFLIKRFIPFIQIVKIEMTTEKRKSSRMMTRNVNYLYILTTLGKSYKISQDFVRSFETIHHEILKIVGKNTN